MSLARFLSAWGTLLTLGKEWSIGQDPSSGVAVQCVCSHPAILSNQRMRTFAGPFFFLPSLWISNVARGNREREGVSESERWGLDLTDCPFRDGLSWLVGGNAGRIAWTRSSVAWTADRRQPLPPVLSCSFPGASSRSCRFWIWIGESQTLDHTCWVADLPRVQNPGYKKKDGETNKLSHRSFCLLFFFLRSKIIGHRRKTMKKISKQIPKS